MCLVQILNNFGVVQVRQADDLLPLADLRGYVADPSEVDVVRGFDMAYVVLDAHRADGLGWLVASVQRVHLNMHRRAPLLVRHL